MVTISIAGCGVKGGGRIINGTVAAQNEFPWICSVNYSDNTVSNKLSWVVPSSVVELSWGWAWIWFSLMIEVFEVFNWSIWSSILLLSWLGGWFGGWVAVIAGNKANLSLSLSWVEAELGLSLISLLFWTGGWVGGWVGGWLAGWLDLSENKANLSLSWSWVELSWVEAELGKKRI